MRFDRTQEVGAKRRERKKTAQTNRQTLNPIYLFAYIFTSTLHRPRRVCYFFFSFGQFLFVNNWSRPTNKLLVILYYIVAICYSSSVMPLHTTSSASALNDMRHNVEAFHTSHVIEILTVIFAYDFVLFSCWMLFFSLSRFRSARSR